MVYPTDTMQNSTDPKSASCQAALAAAAMFSSDLKSKSNNSNRYPTTNNTYNTISKRQQSFSPKVRHSFSPTRMAKEVSASHYSVINNDQQIDSLLIPQPQPQPSRKLYKTTVPRRKPPATSTAPVPMMKSASASTLSLQRPNSPQYSQNINHNNNNNPSATPIQHSASTSNWNNINQNYSSTALAAAASIAKTNPNSLISSSTSPKLIRKKPLSRQPSISNPTVRRSSQQYLNFDYNNSTPQFDSSPSITSPTQQQDTSTLSSAIPPSSISSDKKLSRKPPPPSRSSTSFNENYNSSFSNRNSLDNKDHKLKVPDLSFETATPTDHSFQFPVHENSTSTQSNISIPYPHSKPSSPNASPTSKFHFSYTTGEQFSNPPSPELSHRRSLSKSQKLSNFFTVKPPHNNNYNGNNNNSELYRLQSNSTSVLPSHMHQLSINDSNVSFNNDIFQYDAPQTAPNMTANYHYPYYPATHARQKSFQDDLYLTPNTSSSKIMMNNNSSTASNIYQQNAQQQSLPSANQLVFKTTLRKDPKKLGFGRSKKNKGEFDEDKPWKYHERGQQLNVIVPDEKKRYEGVFAANKGVYINLDLRLIQSNKMEKQINIETDSINDRTLADFVNTYSNPNDRIHGLIVREIWARSKLDEDTLRKMWSLVLDDRKRRWIKLISNGNIDWLPEEYYEEIYVDADAGDECIGSSSVLSDTNILEESDNTVDDSIKNDDDMQSSENVEDCNGGVNGDTNADVGDGYNDGQIDGGTDDSETVNNETIRVKNNQNGLVLHTPNIELETIESSLGAESQPDDLNHDEPEEVNTTTITAEHERKKSDVSYNLTVDLLDINRNLFDDGTLTCDEFTVGMWLVDQCLYGRKIPKVVPISVWETIGINWSYHSSSGSGVGVSHGSVVSNGGSNGGDYMGSGYGYRGSKKSGKRRVLKKVIGI